LAIASDRAHLTVAAFSGLSRSRDRCDVVLGTAQRTRRSRAPWTTGIGGFRWKTFWELWYNL